MKAPENFNLELQNLSQDQSLDCLTALVTSDYLGQYNLLSTKVVAKGLDIGIECFASDSGILTVRDLSKILATTISPVRSSKVKLERAKLVIAPTVEMMRRFGVNPEAREELLTFDLNFDINRVSREIFYFQAYNSGLNRSYYEGQGQLALYRKDRKSLLAWYREIDPILKDLLAPQR